MLVLSRKAGEQIHIGPDITVTLVAIRGGQIRLGFEAPLDVPIWRHELPGPIPKPPRQPKDNPEP